MIGFFYAQSEYSLLDNALFLDDLVKKAKEECECIECKNRRYWEGMSLYLEVQQRIMNVFLESLKDSEKKP